MYNEAAGAARTVREVVAALECARARAALIVVDDGSTDGTGTVLARLGSLGGRLVVVTHGTNRGYGTALQSGAREAAARAFDYVLYMDSDLTNSPDDISRFVAWMEQGADLVKATRYGPGGGVRGVPRWRVLISALGNRVARRLFGLPLRDCTNGFRAVRVSLLQQMELAESRFPLIMEELYWCKFLARTFAEVPVVLLARAEDRRPSSFSYSPAVFWRYLRYPLLAFLGIRPARLRHPS
jgi:dolichol-phosphate mannosyltransferase